MLFIRKVAGERACLGTSDRARAPARARRRPMSEPAPAPRPFCVDDQGVWGEILRSPRTPALRPALFLDRDRVIVEEVGHLRRAEDVRLIAGAAAVIAGRPRHAAGARPPRRS